MHGRFEYKGFSIVLVDVLRMQEKACRDAVRLVFSPEGYVINRGQEVQLAAAKAAGSYVKKRL